MKKSLIIYASSHGNTRGILEEICSGSENIDLKEVSDVTGNMLDQYDKVALGGSIHASRIQGSVRNFFTKHEAVLKEKNIALFLCCLGQNEAMAQLESVFPESLRKRAAVLLPLGGSLDLNRLNPFLKFLMKRITAKKPPPSWRNDENIAELKNFLTT